jgi:DHA1 family tetracycline resistance protein-like MFS transporter
LTVVYITVFIDLLGFGILLPVLPFYATKFGAGGLALGGLMSSYSAAQFFGAMVWGRLSDRIGRKPVLLFTMAGTAATLVVLGLTRGLAGLLIVRALNGLFAGNIAAAQAYIADAVKPQERAKYMGIMGAAIGLGFVFGPALGAWLAPYGFGAAAFAGAGLSGANLIVAFFLLHEIRRKPPAADVPIVSEWSRIRESLARPFIKNILAATFFYTLAFTAVHATYPLLGQRQFGLDAKGLGIVFASVGLVSALVQGGLVGRIAPRLGENVTAAVGLALMAVAYVALPYAHRLSWSVAGMVAAAFGNGLVLPAIAGLLSRNSDWRSQGGVLGMGQSLQAGARAVGPLAAGALFDFAPVAPYAIGAAIFLAVAVLMLRVKAVDADAG